MIQMAEQQRLPRPQCRFPAILAHRDAAAANVNEVEARLRAVPPARISGAFLTRGANHGKLYFSDIPPTELAPEPVAIGHADIDRCQMILDRAVPMFKGRETARRGRRNMIAGLAHQQSVSLGAALDAAAPSVPLNSNQGAAP